MYTNKLLDVHSTKKSLIFAHETHIFSLQSSANISTPKTCQICQFLFSRMTSDITNLVSLDSRYGTCGWCSTSAVMTRPNVNSDCHEKFSEIRDYCRGTKRGVRNMCIRLICFVKLSHSMKRHSTSESHQEECDDFDKTKS